MDNQSEKKVMAVNGLFYQMPAPLSTTLIRTYKKQYSQRTQYSPGDTIVFDFNVSGFVDPELCHIKLQVDAVGQNSYFDPRGSVANLFREVRLQSKNGAELDRIEHVNDWVHHYLMNNYPADKLQEYATNWGYQQGPGTMIAGQSYIYTLPLSFILGAFRPYVKGQKVPPQMLSGARLEIQLENANKALISTAGGSYNVVRPEILLMEHTLNDNSNKVIVENSANDGLEYAYPRIFTSVESSSVADFNSQIKKAVSQATAVYTIPKPSAQQSDITADSFESLAGIGNFNDYSYRIGSNYFPHQIVDNIAEAFEISSNVCGKREKRSPITNASLYRLNLFHMSVPIKKENDISASGLAVNNSTSLEVRYNSGNTNAKTIYTFLEYVTLARVFLSQVSVKI